VSLLPLLSASRCDAKGSGGGGSVTVSFDVTVNANTPDSTIISNSASVTGTGATTRLPLAAAGLIIEQLNVTTTELEGVTAFALPGYPALVRQEMGSVVELDGKTERQFCFPLSVLRSRPVGVAAVGALPSGCSVADRLEATRFALAHHAVALRNDLVVRAYAIAAETSDHPVDFATSGSGADVEMLYACAMVTCPLIVVSQQVCQPGILGRSGREDWKNC
jgi:hypothetical protein